MVDDLSGTRLSSPKLEIKPSASMAPHSSGISQTSNGRALREAVVLCIDLKGDVHPSSHPGISCSDPEDPNQHLHARTQSCREHTYLITLGVCFRSRGGSIRSFLRCFCVSVFNQSLS